MKNVYPQRFVLSKQTLLNTSKRLISKTVLLSVLTAACFGFSTKSNAQCTTGNTSTPLSFHATANQVIGQSITTTCSGNIRQATFHLPLAAIGSTQTIYLKVYVGNGLSAPVNQNPIPVSAVVNSNNDAVIDFATFPIAVAVSANSAYTFTAFQTSTWVVGYSSANPYSGGNAFYANGTGKATSVTPAGPVAQPTADFGFTLKICDPTSSTTNTTACDSLVWNGTTYKTSGSYSKVFPSGNSGGCDSTAYLNLTINHSSSSDTTASVCNSFTWHAITYYHTGDKMDTIPNASGCDSIITLHLTIRTVDNTFSKTDAGCFGSATGSATIAPTITTAGPYKYRLGTVGPINAISGTFNNLKAGSYRLYVQDATGCIGVAAPVIVGQSDKVTATITGTYLTCFGSGNGTITISDPVGVGPFQYKIGIGGVYAPFTAPYTITGKKAGRYAVYIKDQSGCEGPANVVNVLQPAKISATYNKTDESCPSVKDGSITAAGTGGFSPYQFKLNTTGTYGPGNTFPGLAAGTYKVYAKDSHGCQGVSPVIVINDITDPCPPPGPFARIAPKTTTDQSLKLSLLPNPSASQFRLVAHSGNTAESVSVRVIDANGRSVYETKGQPEQSFMFGDKLSNGLYMIEVRQGNEVKTIKAMKQR